MTTGLDGYNPSVIWLKKTHKRQTPPLKRRLKVLAKITVLPFGGKIFFLLKNILFCPGDGFFFSKPWMTMDNSDTAHLVGL